MRPRKEASIVLYVPHDEGHKPWNCELLQKLACLATLDPPILDSAGKLRNKSKIVFNKILSPHQHCQSLTAPVVIVNTSRSRADALIITDPTHDRPEIVTLSKELDSLASSRLVDLRNDQEKLVDGMSTDTIFHWRVLMPILRGLWNEVAQPVYNTLTIIALEARRIWWCPTGNLSFLALHMVTNGI
ncbi:hypothetical protein BDZ97DRAFT_1858239, partial [Flammula alnicola]